MQSHYSPAFHAAQAADWPLAHLQSGMPQERLAQMAARRSFVAMKDRFTAAVRHAPGDNGHWLRERVRAAEEPFDLWLLRIEVLEALPMFGREAREQRQAIERALSEAFAATSQPPIEG